MSQIRAGGARLPVGPVSPRDAISGWDRGLGRGQRAALTVGTISPVQRAPTDRQLGSLWTIREVGPSDPGEGHEWHLDLHGPFEWRSAVVVYGMEGPDKHDAEGYARALSILAFLNGSDR